MINNNWPPSPADPPIEIGPPTTRVDNGVAWRPLLPRLFVVVPPAQVLGIVAGAQLMAGTGLLGTHASAQRGDQRDQRCVERIGRRLHDTDDSAAAHLRPCRGRFGLTTTVVLAVLSEVRLAATNCHATRVTTVSQSSFSASRAGPVGRSSSSVRAASAR